MSRVQRWSAPLFLLAFGLAAYLRGFSLLGPTSHAGEVEHPLSTAETVTRPDGWVQIRGTDGTAAHTYNRWLAHSHHAHGGGIVLAHGNAEIRTGNYVRPKVTQLATSAVDGFNTYELALVSNNEDSWSCYAIFGNTATALSMPPAYQVAAPFGTNIGGVDKALIAAMPVAKFDSWLAVGRGFGSDKVFSIGVDFDNWNQTAPLKSTNGAVFWSEPDHAPVLATPDDKSDTDEPVSVVVAQLTISEGSQVLATMNAQGRTEDGNWEQSGIRFSY